VVGYHLIPLPKWEGFGDLGRTGVLLFFLVSGYCIAFSLEQTSRRPILSFWVRRICRLYPAYWLAVIVAIALDGGGHSLWVYLANLTMVQTALHQPDLVGVFWTLFYELAFYALASLFLPLGIMNSGRRLAGVTALLLTLSLVFVVGKTVWGLPLPFSFPLFMTVFFAGSLFYRLDKDRSWRPVLATLGLIGGIAAVGVISRLAYGDQCISNETYSSFLGNHILALGLFLIFSRVWTITARPFVLLGHISYSLYLFHSLVPMILGSTEASAVFNITAAVIVAVIVHVVVEQPGIAAGRWIVSAAGSKPRLVVSG
jgi:peptidoglycan/LPS O-acetylase OafA/YrhL